MSNLAEDPTPPIFPESSRDFVNSISHYYRGEISRMISWRERIDLTTNWAIGVVAAMLSFSLANPQSHHGVLLMSMVVVTLILVIESRRYRFFHVYRSRVRLLERSYYASLFGRTRTDDPSRWMDVLAEDLRNPRFNLTMLQALARRLRRNYYWILLILLVAWLLKTAAGLPAEAAGTAAARAWIATAGIGPVPGELLLVILVALHGWMLYVMIVHREAPGELAFGEVHV